MNEGGDSTAKGLSGELPVAGWYNDPEVDGNQRYWDGTAWGADSVPINPAPNHPTSVPAPVNTATINTATINTASINTEAVDTATRSAPDNREDRQSRRKRGKGGSAALVAGSIFGFLGLLLVGGCGVLLVGVPLFFGGVSEERVAVEAFPEPTRAFPDDFPDEFTTTTGPPVTGTIPPGLPTTQGAAITAETPPGLVVGFGSPMTAPSNLGSNGGFAAWDVIVEAPVDISEEVLAANPLDPEPLDNVRHVSIPLTITLLESEQAPFPIADLEEGLSVAFVGGATGAGYVPEDTEDDSFGCSAVVEPFPNSGELLSGDSIAASICIQVPTVDLDHIDSHIQVRINGAPPLIWTG